MVSDSVLHTDRGSSILPFGTKYGSVLPSVENKYCPFCDFHYGEPDSCLCDENCGAIGCQGSNSSERD
jgi:hypothetical protein